MQNKGGLKHKFEGFGSQPSEKLWDSIASNLDQKKKRRGIIFWWLGSIFAVGTLVFFGVKYVGETADINMSNPISKKSRVINKQSIIQSNTTNQIVALESTELTDSSSNSNNLTSSNLVVDQKIKEQEKVKTQNNSSKTSVNNSKNTIPNVQITQFETSELKKVKPVEFEEEKNVPIIENKVDINKLNVPLWAELPVIMNSQLGRNNIEMPLTKPNWIYSFHIESQKGFKFSKNVYDSPNETAIASNSQDLFFQEPIQSFRPLTLRFGMAKQFKKRLSFQTGIDLGWIQSNSNVSKSSIFTLGIPVKLNLTMIERKKAAFYSNFGLVNDIPLFEMTRNFNGDKYELASSKLVTGFLGGTELGLGFNYKLNERLKFDVNSGFKWYYYQSAKTNNSITSQNMFLTFNAGLIWNY